MYVAVGALMLSQQQQVAAVLPACYTQEFDDCLEVPQAPECERYAPIEAAYDADFEATELLVDEVPYCSSADMLKRNLMLAAGGFVVGMVVIAIVR